MNIERLIVVLRDSVYTSFISAAVIFLGAFCPVAICAQTVAAPPVAPVRAVSDEYFGVKVSDPYRYMENLNDPEVAAWFNEQDAHTRSVLAEIPGRTALLARIRQLDQTGRHASLMYSAIRTTDITTRRDCPVRRSGNFTSVSD